MAPSLSRFYLWTVILLVSLSAGPVRMQKITLHHKALQFSQAAQKCSPNVLASLITQQDVARVLQLISDLQQHQFTYWVGLKKDKNMCVSPLLPLRGFQWRDGSSQGSELIRWLEEPESTCTSLLCAALKGESNGTAVTTWGLIPVSCTNDYYFICKSIHGHKHEDAEATAGPSATEPAAEEMEHTTTERATIEVKVTAQGTALPETTPSVVEPETNQTGEPDLGHKPHTGSASDSCIPPSSSEIRSRSSVLDNSSRIQIECWSDVKVELHCAGRPPVWRLPDESPALFPKVCLPCRQGFLKDPAGKCVDIDECENTPCKHTCLNTDGAYKCICLDQNGNYQDEDLQLCANEQEDTKTGTTSGILFPILIGVAALVVLLVVVAVTVKCCLMRRSKKKANRQGE